MSLRYCCSVSSYESLFLVDGDWCDQIGRFLKALGDKLSFKSSPNVQCVLGYFENITFSVKTAIVTFLGNFRKNWATFLIHYLVTLMAWPKG